MNIFFLRGWQSIPGSETDLFGQNAPKENGGKK
jgi:hypothetical protein